mmetsp:Transcript_13136/g.27135  ORF Transcript_13136/g.27135 Transcript_13136/m.27135 type:complete len:369 (-) Transcript_13136:32-1138(-)
MLRGSWHIRTALGLSRLSRNALKYPPKCGCLFDTRLIGHRELGGKSASQGQEGVEKPESVSSSCGKSSDLNLKSGNRWATFARDWNTSLSLHPQDTVVSLLAAQSTTWVALFASLSVVTSSNLGVVLSPDLAAGFLVARLTKKIRQPANIALAAGLARVFPGLSDVKVTPLVTGFVGNDAARRELESSKQKIETAIPVMKKIFDAGSRGAAWLAGPIDKYGLSFYLSGRITGLATVGLSTYMISCGIDMESVLSSWGISKELGSAVGTVAAASIGNTLFTPVHFIAAVYGVRSMERLEKKLNHGALVGKEHLEKKEQQETSDDKKGKEEHFHGIKGKLQALLLLYTLGVSLYITRLMGEGEEKELDDK